MEGLVRYQYENKILSYYDGEHYQVYAIYAVEINITNYLLIILLNSGNITLSGGTISDIRKGTSMDRKTENMYFWQYQPVEKLKLPEFYLKEN